MNNDNQNSLSPRPNSPEVHEEGIILLNFGQAMEIVLVGKRIHKLEWENKEYYGVLNDGVLKLHKPDGQLYDWIISENDISGTDYIIL